MKNETKPAIGGVYELNEVYEYIANGGEMNEVKNENPCFKEYENSY